jgi:tetratricopeptide (TPR) repeat protein
LLAGSFHTALISLHHFFLRGTEFNYSMLALFAGGITFSCFFAFMLYRTYKESYSYLIERTKNNLVSESCQTSSSNQPTETEIGKSIRQLIKEENFKEANKVAKTFYLLKKGAVRPEFAMRMIELLLEIDKISEAKELLGKIEKTKAIEEKKQQLSLVLAYTNILNGELAKFLKAIEEAKQGNAWLAQTDLYTIDFCYGLFHFQQHQYKEAINFLKKSLKNATTAASKMKAYFWEGMCFYELGETSEIENLISHSKNVVGLEISQSYKKLNEALLLASQKKKPEAIKTCKISLSFNEMSAPANFLICKLSVEAKEYGELQKAAFSIDKDHFLSFKALKFVV